MLQTEPTVMRTDRSDIAHAHLARMLFPHRVRCEPRDGRLAFAHCCGRLDGLAIHRLSYGAPVRVRVCEPRGFYMLQLTLAGRTSVASGSQRVTQTPGSLAVVGPDHGFEKRWSADADQVIVRIDRARIDAPRADWNEGRASWPEVASFDGAQSTRLRRVIMDLAAGLEAGWSGAESGDHEAAILDLTLELMRESAGQSERSAAAPGFLRRAERFVDTHAGEDITVADIADAGRVHPRTLTSGFRRFRDTTPTEWLRAVRLDRARARLLAGEAGASVTSIALECGLAHLGRFSSLYAARFGELPSATFARARSSRPNADSRLRH